jgi:hypothetical protein
MKRTVSTAERNAAKGNRWSLYRLSATNPDGTWLDLGALTAGGVTANFNNTAQIANHIDANTVSLTATVRREIGSLSLAPLRTDSPLNVRADFTYGPALDLSRQWKIDVAVVPWGIVPTAADFRPLAQGIITTLDISGEPANSKTPGTITIAGRGLETRLLRAFMTSAVTYTTAAIEAALQAMVDRWIGAGAVDVYPDATAPSYLVNGWTQDKGPLMPALQTVAGLPGAVVRYEYDAADVLRFTLSKPNRNPTSPDYVLGPDEYKSVPLARLDSDGIRNYIVVTYTDATFGPDMVVTSPAAEPGTVSAVAGVATFSASQAGVLAVGAVIVVDDVPYKVLTFDGTTGATLEGTPTFAGKSWVTSASITRYGLQILPIDLGSDTRIQSQADAGDFADGVRSDMEFPAIEQQIETEGGWFYNLGDYLQLEPNVTHYNDVQFGGVTSYTHNFAGGKLMTLLGLRGKPAGRYRTWLALGSGAPRAAFVPGITAYDGDYWETYAIDGITLTGAGVMDTGTVNAYTRSVAVEVTTDPTFATVEFIEYTNVPAGATFTHQWAGASRAQIYWFRATPWSGPLDGGGLPTGVAGPPAIARTWNTPQVPTKPAFDLLDSTVDGILADYASQSYVDAKVAGLSWKQAVRAATAAAGTLASSFENGDTIDGVVLATGDRILIKNQATASENGIYVVAASGAPTRATDANSSAKLVNATCYVSEGTANADTQWTCTNNAPITVGTTALAFAQLASGGTPSAVSINTQTASYTLVLTDAFKSVQMNVATSNTTTVPPNSSVAFPVGTVIEVVQYGAGQTTIAAGAGVTLRTATSLTLRTRYSVMSLLKIATDEWIVSGDML